jgi:hypothetical protein
VDEDCIRSSLPVAVVDDELIATALPVVKLLAMTDIAPPAVVLSITTTPPPVWLPEKRKFTPPLVKAALDADETLNAVPV